MYSVCAFLVLTLLSAASAQGCTCPTMKWANCDSPSCACTLLIADNTLQNINCSKLIPKCFLMKAEMYRASKGHSTRRLGKPTEHAFVDNDGIYDPECDSNGVFKARQCNHTETCWCVNSAGVRRTDKGDLNLKCDKLVQTTWVQAQLTINPVQTPVDPVALKAAMTQTIQNRYFLDPSYVDNVQYSKDDNIIIVDLKNTKGDPNVDIATVAYYMEKDVKVLPLFMSNSSLTTTVNGTPLGFRNILVYYVDAEPPTFTMKKLTAGIIAVIVVVVLAIIAGLVVLFLTRKKEKSQTYQKAQSRELDDMQKEQLAS
uniref:Epithelial cell adhesion molecule n=2 Tax=Erpetoichthys calabaricus TaxID=27687 RepID=A0A8C4XFU1_ERPCA